MNVVRSVSLRGSVKGWPSQQCSLFLQDGPLLRREAGCCHCYCCPFHNCYSNQIKSQCASWGERSRLSSISQLLLQSNQITILKKEAGCPSYRTSQLLLQITTTGSVQGNSSKACNNQQSNKQCSWSSQKIWTESTFQAFMLNIFSTSVRQTKATTHVPRRAITIFQLWILPYKIIIDFSSFGQDWSRALRYMKKTPCILKWFLASKFNSLKCSNLI